MIPQLKWPGISGSTMLLVLTFVAAATAIQLVYRAIDLPDGNWAVTSVALVMQTQAGASLRVAAIRVVVNVVSAIVAALALHLGGASIPSFGAALLVVGLFCYMTKLDDGLRSAYICVIIVFGADRFAALSPPIYRIVAVAIGSAVGIGVSWIFAWINRRAAAPATAGRS
jgi:uncharacterized membrane protein YccC